jgi:transposase
MPASEPLPDDSLPIGSDSSDSLAARATPRFQAPDRLQIEFRACCWNDLLPADHEACLVWQYVAQLDLSELYGQIKAVERHPGQPPIDPRILLSLWLYATLRGVGIARELSRRCGGQGELPFRWICGGVSVNHHTLSDFRNKHATFLDQLLTRSVAVLLHEGLVTMDRVAQDGMKVRASAGAASFRRRESLEEHLALAEEQVQSLKAELESDSDAANKRQRAARERAARERVERLNSALEQLPLVEAHKRSGEEKLKARVSTTDPEARVMKMPDGGFRPAYNVQLATDTQTQIITGVDVVNSGSDQGQLAPMIEQHEDRYEQTPAEMLVDGGFVKKDDIIAVSAPQGSTTVYAPVPPAKKEGQDPHAPRADDEPAVAEWRTRMGSDEAKLIYKDRASTAECVNAIARNRGLYQVRVRGKSKVLAVVLLYALAHNLMRAVALRAGNDKKPK